VRERLGDAGVESGIHYPVPLHVQPAFRALGYSVGDFPVSERRAEHILSLPMFPEIDQTQRDYVVAALEQALA
jgi:dTDP-4-amino-4,6-dideoxygalactose transaminase